MLKDYVLSMYGNIKDNDNVNQIKQNNDRNNVSKEILEDFKEKIKQTLINGLGSKHNTIRKLILDHL